MATLCLAELDEAALQMLGCRPDDRCRPAAAATSFLHVQSGTEQGLDRGRTAQFAGPNRANAAAAAALSTMGPA